MTISSKYLIDNGFKDSYEDGILSRNEDPTAIRMFSKHINIPNHIGHTLILFKSNNSDVYTTNISSIPIKLKFISELNMLIGLMTKYQL
jgi:hypothetical protein